jgi:hypothetical protein
MSHGSSLTTSLTLRVRVPRHVARLVVDFFAHAARPGASARRAARRRLLRPRRASGCLGTSHGSSSTTSPMLRVRVTRHVTRLVVDNFSHAAHLGASAHRAARCAATSPRTASRRLLHLRRAYGCLGTSRGSSSTSSPTPHVRVPRYVAWHVECLVVDYFTYAACPGASAHHAARRVARHRLLHLRRASGFPGTSHG